MVDLYGKTVFFLSKQNLFVKGLMNNLKDKKIKIV